MKSIIKLIPIIALCGILFQNCDKYPDGGAFSLRSRDARLTGRWTYENVTLNGVDITDIVKANDPDYRLDFEENGTYNVQGKYSDHGTWKFGEDFDDVYLDSNDPGKVEVAMRITRLLNSSIWYTTTASNGVKTYWKIKQ